jgi:hypothetical protein
VRESEAELDLGEQEEAVLGGGVYKRGTPVLVAVSVSRAGRPTRPRQSYQGSGFRVQGSGFRVQSSGFRVESPPFHPPMPGGIGARAAHGIGYRGTSLIRNTPLLGPYSRTLPRVLWWS